MKATIKGKKLILEIDLEDERPSASGKTNVVFTSSGFQSTGVKLPNGKEPKCSVNVIVPVK